MPSTDSLLESWPLNWWYGIGNVARVRVNGECCMVLLDNGTQINTIMPGCVENHSLDIRPISDLMGRWVICIGLGNALTWPIGYIIIWVQVDGVQCYDEDQIALVIRDLSNFMAQVPVILGTSMIGHVMNVIKESEMDTLVTPWVNSQVAYLLTVQWATAMVENNKVAPRVLDPTGYDEIVTTRDSKMIDAFSSKIINARMKTVFTSVRLNIMTQALHAERGHCCRVWQYRTPTLRCTMEAKVSPLWKGMAQPTLRPWRRRSQ